MKLLAPLRNWWKNRNRVRTIQPMSKDDRRF